MFRSPETVLRPRSLAIVGASDGESADNWSKIVYDNVRSAGTGMTVYPVNPRHAAMWGQRCFPALDKLPQPVELALVAAPALDVPEILRAGVEAGLRASIVYSGGFDLRSSAQVEALCAKGLRVCGPGCMGTLSVHERLLFYPSNPVTRVRTLPAGDLGVVFQSGATVQFWLQQAATRGLGFSYVVTTGSELDLDLADYLNFLVEDPRTRLICCMLSDVRRPDAFVEAARKALALGKPILVVKPGSDPVFEAVCERFGIVRCPSLDDLIEATIALRFGFAPRGRRIALLAASDDAYALFLDEARAAKLDVCSESADDPNVDVVAVQAQLPTLPDDRQKPDAFRALAQSIEKPVIAWSPTAQNVTDAGREFQRAAGLPFVQGIPQAARVIRALIGYGERRAERPAAAGSEPVSDTGVQDFAPILAGYGIASPQYRYAGSPDEAVQAARDFGYPVALKAIAPAVLHKSEMGAVRLGLDDAIAVQRAAIELANNLRARGIAPSHLLVQEMVPGLEMLVAARDDDRFGPFIVAGVGGFLTEAYGDVAMRLLPVEPSDVRSMIEELRLAAVLREFRGRAVRDVDAFVEAVVGIGRFYLERRAWIREVEVDPLMLLERGYGVRAVDVRVIRRAA